MLDLLLVSIIWAFSFGLIKNILAGIDPNFISFARLAISFLVFLPFLRLRKIKFKLLWKLLFTGAIQFGLMYIAYNYAFQVLKAYEVALFTILTPIYVTVVNDILEKRLHWVALLAATMAVAGTAIIQVSAPPGGDLLAGFLIVQASNLCFAIGQVVYRRSLPAGLGLTDAQVFAVLYLGGVVATAISTTIFVRWDSIIINPNQWLALLYLGMIASGLGFFLFNRGARKVDTGTLAVFNNVKIPLAIAVSLLFFGEKANLTTLLVGGAIMVAALLINRFSRPPINIPQNSTFKD